MAKHRFKTIDNAVKRIRKLEELLEYYKADCQTFKSQRVLLARLAAEKPEFSNPLEVWEAKMLRDRILSNKS